MSACGWRVWQEKRWPWQWVGQCGDGVTCRGGIRCNDKATAEAFFSASQAGRCVSIRERPPAGPQEAKP
jgi:hypothetical protein